MTDQLADLAHDLPSYLGGHMTLSLAALSAGLVISLPAGVLASRRPRLAEWALGIAGVVQTVPSLALLALMVPLLGGMIGFVPAFLALVLYSILPILANTITGLRGVDPVLVEAARGLGMTDRQLLRRVQLPLAAPVIIAGIRTATVLVIGSATLATPVGETTLGNYIFAGLNTRDTTATVFGCLCAAVLAVLLDQLIRLLELAARRRSRAMAWTGAVGLLVVIGGGLYGPMARAVQAAPRPVIVGSADYTEQHILSEVIRGRLVHAGFPVDQRRGMGETIELAALRSSTIDCYVDYTGNIWATVMKRSTPAGRAEMLAEVSDYLQQQHGVTCLGALGFENSYALAMPRARADALGIRNISDLRRHAPHMKMAADLQFFSRPEWARLRDHHDLHFQATLPMDPALMYEAVAGHRPSVDAIVAYTSDARIRTCDLVILEDGDEVLPHYDAILLVSPRAAGRPELLDALRPLIGRIDVETMRTINGRVDVEKKRPRQAADELLTRLEGRSD